MDLRIDHVPFAWRDLDALTAEFERLGLAPTYGGRHDNGTTHMSVLGFDDRSYVELIALVDPEDDRSAFDYWPEHVRASAGPAAWSVRVDDVHRTARRAIDAGYPVSGPWHGSREREDGTTVEWDRVEIGADRERLLFPFAIEDRTPLSYRAVESDSVAGGPLTGIGQVVVAVHDLETAVRQLRDFFRLPKPTVETVPSYGAEVAAFPGQPVALVQPTGPESWLADRLERFPPCPCGVLLETGDLAAVAEAYPVGEPVAWPGGTVRWFDSDVLDRQLGVIERS